MEISRYNGVDSDVPVFDVMGGDHGGRTEGRDAIVYAKARQAAPVPS